MYMFSYRSNLTFNINVCILLTVFHILRATCRENLYKVNVNWFDPWWSFPIFSRPVLLTKKWFGKEKLDGGHYWDIKG